MKHFSKEEFKRQITSLYEGIENDLAEAKHDLELLNEKGAGFFELGQATGRIMAYEAIYKGLKESFRL